jgi:hypothetical protein
MCLVAYAQDRVNVYPDNRMLWSEMMLHAEQGLIREGRDWRGTVLWTTRPGELFEGYSSSSFDLKFTVRDGHLIQGDSNFSDAILYTLDGIRSTSATVLFLWIWSTHFSRMPLTQALLVCTKKTALACSIASACSKASLSPEVLFGFSAGARPALMG